jgi:uncharacterized membrane protein
MTLDPIQTPESTETMSHKDPWRIVLAIAMSLVAILHFATPDPFVGCVDRLGLVLCKAGATPLSSDAVAIVSLWW